MIPSIWLRRIYLAALTGAVVALASPFSAFAEEPSGGQQSGTAAVADQSPAAELSLWNDIKESSNPGDFENYLNRFPNGMFFDPAKTRYEELTGRSFVPSPAAASDGTSGQDTESSETATPAQPATIQSAPKPKKVQVKAKQKIRKKVVAKKTKKIAIKSKKRLASTAEKPRLKKKVAKTTRRPLAGTAKPKRAKTVSNRKTCNTTLTGPGCPVIVKKTKPIIPIRSGGGNGGGGGSGGGGGWGG